MKELHIQQVLVEEMNESIAHDLPGHLISGTEDWEILHHLLFGGSPKPGWIDPLLGIDACHTSYPLKKSCSYSKNNNFSKLPKLIFFFFFYPKH